MPSGWVGRVKRPNVKKETWDVAIKTNKFIRQNLFLNTQKKKMKSLKIRNSRKIYFPIYLMVILLITLIISIKLLGLNLNILAFGGAAIFALISFGATEIHRLGRAYQITPNFLEHTQGYLSKRIKKISLASISDVDLKQTLWQRIIKFGDVHVHLFSEGSLVHVKGINKPHEFIEYLEEMISLRKRLEQGGTLK